MVCDPQNRIGQHVEEIIAHPFFRGTDWEHIRDRPSAIQVNVKHMADTSNFDDFEELDEQKKSECVCVCGGGTVLLLGYLYLIPQLACVSLPAVLQLG